MENRVPEDVGIKLYETMVRIRKFESAVVDLFARGKIPGFLHTYVGEEAIAAGVCMVLRVSDNIISTHRGHGHLIAKGGRFSLMMAELFGRRTGYNKGKGGSMHIAEPDLGMLGANAIVGAGTAIINGAAFTAQYLGTDRVAVCFFGDGAANTGAFHESMNLAAAWNLPTIFVCENNGWAESTPQHVHQRVKDIGIRATGYGMPHESVDGNDVEAVYFAARAAVERARSGGGPTLIEGKTCRMRGHYEGDPQTYRSKEEVEAWRNKCPVTRWRNTMLERGAAAEALQSIDARVEEDLQQAVAFAEASPVPDILEARTDIFTPWP
jgi:acetoin:2,6-dichlorophenolindophenol oxidoreductase subunit alpha